MMAPFYRDCIRLIFRVVTLPGEKAGLSSLKPPNAIGHSMSAHHECSSHAWRLCGRI